MRPSQLDPRVAGVLGRSAAVSGPSPATQQAYVGSQPGDRLEQHGEALALLVPAQKKIVGPSPDRRGVAAIAVDLDAVEQHRVVAAAEVATARAPSASFDTTHLQVDARDSQRDEHAARRSGSWTSARRRGTCRRAGRRVHEQRRHRRAGSQRLVEVEHVERLVAQRADGAQRGRGSGASGAIDPLAAVGRLLPSGVTNGLGRRPVARPEHPRLVPMRAAARGPARAPAPARHRARSGCTGRPARSASGRSSPVGERRHGYSRMSGALSADLAAGDRHLVDLVGTVGDAQRPHVGVHRRRAG